MSDLVVIGFPTEAKAEEVRQKLAAQGIAMAVSRARPPVHSLLRRTGFEERIGADHFYPTVRTGVHGIMAAQPPGVA